MSQTVTSSKSMKRKRVDNFAALASIGASADIDEQGVNARKRARNGPRSNLQPSRRGPRSLTKEIRGAASSRLFTSRPGASSGAPNQSADPVIDDVLDGSGDVRTQNAAVDVDEQSSTSEDLSLSSSSHEDTNDEDENSSSTGTLSIPSDDQDSAEDETGAAALSPVADAVSDTERDVPDHTIGPITLASRRSLPSGCSTHPVSLNQPQLIANAGLPQKAADGPQLTLRQPRKVVRNQLRPHPQLSYNAYVADVQSRIAKVFRIDTRTWVLEVHDPLETCKKRIVKEWTFVHSISPALGESALICSNCIDFDQYKTCVHVMYTATPEAQALKRKSDAEFPLAQAFHWVPVTEKNKALLMFACVPVDVRKNAVVAWTGDAGRGTWTCSADPKGVGCEHINAAKVTNILHQLVPSYPKVDEDNLASSEEESAPEDEDMEERVEEQKKREERSFQDKQSECSVSYKPVGSPPFCRITSDTEPWYSTVTPLLDYLPLPKDARCVCGSPPDKHAPKKVVENAIIYSLFGAKQVRLEVQPCSNCPAGRNHYAGPDLREMGLFNFSNYSIFTHELLNSYMSRLFCHPATFHGFCRSMVFDYMNHKSEQPFVSTDVFRAAWFSWTGVMQLFGTGATQSQSCPKCGAEPEVCIADTKTLGFQRQHLTSDLTPPTEILPGAPIRANVQPLPESAACVFGKPRQDAQRLCRWRASLTKAGKSRVGNVVGDLINNDAADVDADETGAIKQSKVRQQARDTVDDQNAAAMPAVIVALEKQCPELAALFDKYVNTPWEKEKEVNRRPFFVLLQQVLAYESVLQFAPTSSWIALGMLAQGNSACIDQLLREIPAFAVAAVEDLAEHGNTFSPEMRGLAAFVRRRADCVMRSLCDGNSHDEVKNPATPPPCEPEDWRKTGQRYGGPIYRLRPSYPQLKHDSRADRSVVSEANAGGIGCNKYYESYGQRGLTGGVFAIWCPHLICVGWHCIPRGEGRNDAFSALFTRWEKAPRVLVYDFACALGPYSMLREPEFFKNTMFLIDDFHAKGHTRCTPACMLRTYRKHNADILKTNSSAAECGNSGLNRIAKSISFMAQRHAVIYTGVFLEIWNRTRTVHAQNLAEKQGITLEEALFDQSLNSEFPGW